MAKRPGLTTQDVLYAIDSSKDENFEVDDPDEPCQAVWTVVMMSLKT